MFFHKTKGRRLLLTALSIALIVGVLALQLFLYSFIGNASFFGDTTTEGLYTMTAAMEKELQDIDEEVSVIFCMEKDRCLQNEDMRPIYVLAKELEQTKPNIKVENLNLRADSHAADAYKVTSATEITEADVIVSYGKKHRSASAESFYTEGDTGRYSFMGEFQLASMILSVVKVNAPVAYFTVGHGESYFDSENLAHPDNESLYSFYYSLVDSGMSVKTLNLDTAAEIPEDCVLLIMNGPTSDYTAPEGGIDTPLLTKTPLEKVESFLDARYGSLLYLQNPSAGTADMPVLSAFLEEQGIAFRKDIVKEGSGHAADSRLSVVYAQPESSSVAYAMYEAIAGLKTAPRTVISDTSSLYCPWRDTTEKMLLENVSRTAVPLFYSSEASGRYNDRQELLEGGSFPVGMLGVTVTTSTSEGTRQFSYVIALGSTSYITEAVYGSQAYANRDILRAVMRTATSTDAYASSGLGSPTDMNNETNYAGKVFHSDDFVTEETQYFIKNGYKMKNSVAGVSESTKQTNIKLYTQSGYRFVREMVPMGGEIVFYVILIFLPSVMILPAIGIVVMLRRRHL